MAAYLADARGYIRFYKLGRTKFTNGKQIVNALPIIP